MSTVLDRQVSEGFPAEGQLFEPPQVSRDNEKERYVTIMGSLIEPGVARDRPWTRFGGMEIANPCLRYVKNFVMKGRITPVLKDTHDYRPSDLVKRQNEGDTSFFMQQIPAGYVAPQLPEGRGPSPVGTLMGKIALPGQQMDAILNGPHNMFQNEPRGVVELKSLEGHPYRPRQVDDFFVDPEIWKIQRTIFPTYPILPILLDEIERLLDDAWEEHAGLRPVLEDAIPSLRQFRGYADTTIQNSHSMMREIASTTQGYIPRYTAMDLVLIEQLGLKRRDREIGQEARQSSADPELKEMFKLFLESQKEEKAAMANFLKSQTSQPTVAVPAAVPDVSETVNKLTCSACGREFDTEHGLAVHEKRWCPKMAQPEQPVPTPDTPVTSPFTSDNE